MSGNGPLPIRVNPSGFRFPERRIAHNQIHRPGSHFEVQCFHVHTQNGNLIVQTIFCDIEGGNIGKIRLHFNPVYVNSRISIGQYHGNDTTASSQIEDRILRTRSGMGGQ